MLKRRDVLKGIGGLAVAGTAYSLGRVRASAQRPRFEGEILHAQFWAGPEGQTIRTYIVDPFQRKTGAKVIVTEGGTEPSTAKMKAEAARPSTSVYFVDERAIVICAREGLLEPLDYSRIPNAADVDPKFTVKGYEKYGIGFFGYTTTLVYNTDVIKTAPTSWKALWDPQYKGKIAIPPPTIGSSMWMAIMAAMLHGGSQYNMEPAWDALRALKPHVAFMEANTAILAELLRNKEVVLSMRPPLYMKEYIEKGYPIGVCKVLKEGVFFGYGCGVLAKNHPDKREVAEAFINEALDPENQAAMANRVWFGPTNQKAKVPPEVARYLVTTQEERDQLIVVDLENQATHRAEWIANYTRALT
jgi:putative spermidine/putrescine transport system substrate-binding protein